MIKKIHEYLKKSLKIYQTNKMFLRNLTSNSTLFLFFHIY